MEGPAKIIVVEDECIIALGIEETLKKMGYLVPVLVTTGEDAILKAEELKPDLVLMDIMLEGDLDGIEAGGYILNKLDIPVVYLTAYYDKKTLERAKITQPFGYILKPFNERELHSNIEIALYRHKMERESRKLSILTRHSVTPVVSFDAEGKIILFNQAANKIFDLKEDQDTNLFEIFSNLEKFNLKELIKKGEVLSKMLTYKDKVFHFEIQGIATLNMGQILITDFTEQSKKLEKNVLDILCEDLAKLIEE